METDCVCFSLGILLYSYTKILMNNNLYIHVAKQLNDTVNSKFEDIKC